MENSLAFLKKKFKSNHFVYQNWNYEKERIAVLSVELQITLLMYDVSHHCSFYMVKKNATCAVHAKMSGWGKIWNYSKLLLWNTKWFQLDVDLDIRRSFSFVLGALWVKTFISIQFETEEDVQGRHRWRLDSNEKSGSFVPQKPSRKEPTVSISGNQVLVFGIKSFEL